MSINNTNKKKFEVVIVGGGIAGLAVGEILSRDNKKILIIEKNNKLLSESSSNQHGWFHFGSLYSIIAENKTLNNMLDNIKNITEFYKSFSSMNIQFQKKNLNFKKKIGWFGNERINYYVISRKHDDLKDTNYLKTLKNIYEWEKKIKLFIARHKKFEHEMEKKEEKFFISNANYLDYSRKYILKPDIKKVRIDPKTHFKIIGFDRTMNTFKISSDLLNSYLSNGGSLKLKTNFISYKKIKKKLIIKTDKGSFETKYLINAMGQNLKKIYKNKFVKNIASPIAVYYPRISNENFVRLSPNNLNTINHLIHTKNKKKYSVVSSGMGIKLKLPDLKKIKKVQNDFLQLVDKYFINHSTKLKKIYTGIKTEYLNLNDRNYNYQIFKKGQNIYNILPGKFTLSFSLARKVYENIYNKKPKNHTKLTFNKRKINKLISRPSHELAKL